MTEQKLKIVNKIVSENSGKDYCCWLSQSWLKLFKQEALSCVWEFGFTPEILEDCEGERTSADVVRSVEWWPLLFSQK